MQNLPVHTPACALMLILLIWSAGCLNAPGTLAGYLSGNTTPPPAATTLPASDGSINASYAIVETLSTEAPAAPQSPVYRPLVVPSGDSSIQARVFNFQYRGTTYSVNVPVNTSLYQAAADSPNKNLNSSGTNGTVGLYRSMMDDPAMDPFFDGLIRELSKERYKGGDNMTDDEYLEMVTSFVQQIPTDNQSTGNPRYPVEVIAGGSGTPGEKAMLLTGILSRQGYNTAFIYFPDLKRAGSAIGIHLPNTNPSFRYFTDGRNDYLFIEPGETRLVGFYDDAIGDAPDPVVIPQGSGTTGYAHVNFVMDIFQDLRSIESQLRMLNEKAGPSRQLNADDYEAAVSYVNTYDFVMSTNDRDAAYSSIRASELPHHSACVTCG